MSWIQWVAFQQTQTRKANDTELTDQHWSHWVLLRSAPLRHLLKMPSWMSSPQPDGSRQDGSFQVGRKEMESGICILKEGAALRRQQGSQPVRPQSFGCTGWTYLQKKRTCMGCNGTILSYLALLQLLCLHRFQQQHLLLTFHCIFLNRRLRSP